jgi:uridine kinase
MGDKENKEVNIIEAYLKYNNQLVVLISGLSGSNKSKIGQNLAKELKLEFINTRDYINNDKFEEVELPNQEKVKIYNNYKWDELIEKINKDKKKGVLVCGEYFPKDKLNDLFIDLHLHIKLSKQNIIKKRLEYIDSLDEDKKKNYKDNDTEVLIINQIIYPYYLDMLQKSHINKFINANEYFESDDFNDKVTDKLFEEIINTIVHNLKNKNLDKYIVY